MTAIKENKRKGKVVSYRFTAYLGTDSEGKQIRKTTTWHPPSDLTPAKERKAAERAADQWEQSLKADDPDEPEATQATAPLSPVPVQPSRSDDFVSFMNDVWFPLAIEGSDRILMSSAHQ